MKYRPKVFSYGLSVLTAMAGVIGAGGPLQAQEKKPNILFIMGDFEVARHPSVPFSNPPVPSLYRHVSLTDWGCLGLWRTLVRFPLLGVAPTFSSCFWAGRDRSACVRATALGGTGAVAGGIALVAPPGSCIAVRYQDEAKKGDQLLISVL
jgi:hypothetical protein